MRLRLSLLQVLSEVLLCLSLLSVLLLEGSFPSFCLRLLVFYLPFRYLHRHLHHLPCSFRHCGNWIMIQESCLLFVLRRLAFPHTSCLAWFYLLQKQLAFYLLDYLLVLLLFPFEKPPCYSAPGAELFG